MQRSQHIRYFMILFFGLYDISIFIIMDHLDEDDHSLPLYISVGLLFSLHLSFLIVTAGLVLLPCSNSYNYRTSLFSHLCPWLFYWHLCLLPSEKLNSIIHFINLFFGGIYIILLFQIHACLKYKIKQPKILVKETASSNIYI
jgi:hypothetical protein